MTVVEALVTSTHLPVEVCYTGLALCKSVVYLGSIPLSLYLIPSYGTILLLDPCHYQSSSTGVLLVRL